MVARVVGVVKGKEEAGDWSPETGVWRREKKD
jgi:hypothetical protein